MNAQQAQVAAMQAQAAAQQQAQQNMMNQNGQNQQNGHTQGQQPGQPGQQGNMAAMYQQQAPPGVQQQVVYPEGMGMPTMPHVGMQQRHAFDPSQGYPQGMPHMVSQINITNILM